MTWVITAKGLNDGGGAAEESSFPNKAGLDPGRAGAGLAVGKAIGGIALSGSRGDSASDMKDETSGGKTIRDSLRSLLSGMADGRRVLRDSLGDAGAAGCASLGISRD